MPEATSAIVCYIRRENKVLLQLKAPGRLGSGRLNGPGGKVMAGETPEEAVVREVKEETGLRITELMHHGTMDFVFGSPERNRLNVFVFTSVDFTGRVQGGVEGTLRWYLEHRIPFDRMWPADRYWLPVVLGGGKVDGICVFDHDGEQTRLLSYFCSCCIKTET